MEQMRKPFQGVWNIIRFNWHFYILSLGLLLLVIILANYLNEESQLYLYIVWLLIFCTTLISLFVSFYVYDLSGLYKLNWLKELKTVEKSKILNIHAGFDETSILLKDKFKNSELIVLDFYDSSKHTEVSIKRARKAYLPFPKTLPVNTSNLPLLGNCADRIFVILSAHEIRKVEKRISFFKELKRLVKPTGKIIVTEHLRDGANFMAYNIGFLHFHSKRSWYKTLL